MLRLIWWFTILGELVSFGFIFDFEPTKPTQPTKERSTKPMGFPLRISNREPQFPPSDSLCLHLFCPETLFRRIVELMEISCHPKARRKTCWFLWGRSPVLPLFSHDINSSNQLRRVYIPIIRIPVIGGRMTWKCVDLILWDFQASKSRSRIHWILWGNPQYLPISSK